MTFLVTALTYENLPPVASNLSGSDASCCCGLVVNFHFETSVCGVAANKSCANIMKCITASHPQTDLAI